MSTIENLFRITDLFSKRNHSLWNIGLVLFFIAMLSAFVIHVFVLDKDNILIKKIKELLFWTGLIGFFFILISFSKGLGIGIGDGTGLLGNGNLSVSTTAQYNSPSAEENIQTAAHSDTLYVRVYGKKIYVADEQCQNVNDMKALVETLYKDSLEVVLLDNYAEYSTYKSVKESLNRIGIRPSERSITKSAGDKK